jgi:integrase
MGPASQEEILASPGCQIDLLIQTKFNCLYVCEIKFSRSEVSVSVTGDIAKSCKTRHVPLNILALQCLNDWRINGNDTGLIFPNPQTGVQFDNVKKAWAGILKAAEIKEFRWHDMRHHFASKLVMAGVDLNTVRELLGHADIKMTLRYAHLAPEHKAKAVARLVEAA